MQIFAVAVWAVIYVGAADRRDRSIAMRRTAYSGLLAALILIFIILGGLSPTANITLYALTSLCVAVMVIEFGLRAGFFLYLTAGLISLAWPGFVFSWPFIVFFGLYPLWQSWTEKMFHKRLVFIIRLAGANLMVWPAVLIVARPAMISLYDRGGFILMFGLLLVSQGVYLLHHWGLTLLTKLYLQRFRIKNTQD